MRCASCNKFAAYGEQDPEVNELSIDENGQVTADVRVVLPCAECNDELKEGSFQTELDMSGDLEGHTTETVPEDDENTHELEVNESGVEFTSRSEGKGRGTRTYYGYKVEFNVTCSCGKLGMTTKDKEGKEKFEAGVPGTIEEDMQASSLDELS